MTRTRPRSFRPVGAQAGRAWPWLLLLVVALAAGGWYAWPWAKSKYDQLAAERAVLRSLPADVAAVRQQAQALAEQQLALTAKLDAESRRVGEMAQALDSGRDGLRLAAVEQLLLVANDQLHLANDVRMARRALDEADRRLARLDDPALLPVREALARERTALAALPDADRAGVALQLGELIRQAPQWPLRARSPGQFSTPVPDVGPELAESWLQRVWDSVAHALAGMFTVRRNQGPAPRLLAPDEEALVAQALRLKLEGARLAVMAGDAATARELMNSARQWLGEYYNPAEPAVAGAQRLLGELAAASVPVPRPEISGSLARLRQIMDQRLVR